MRPPEGRAQGVLAAYRSDHASCLPVLTVVLALSAAPFAHARVGPTAASFDHPRVGGGGPEIGPSLLRYNVDSDVPESEVQTAEDGIDYGRVYLRDPWRRHRKEVPPSIGRSHGCYR